MVWSIVAASSFVVAHENGRQIINRVREQAKTAGLGARTCMHV